MKRWQKILLAIALIIGIGALGGFLFTLQPTNVARENVEHIMAGNVSSAYKMTSPSFKSRTSLDQLQAAVGNLSLSPDDKVSFNSRSVKNNQAIISGTIKTTGGTTYSVEYLMVKGSSGWEVSGISIQPL